MTLKEYERKAVGLCSKLKSVFIYLSKEDEPETRGIIKELFSMGKEVYVPVCDIKDKRIIVSRLDDIDSVKIGAYGIDVPSRIIPAKKEGIDLFFVPGTIFDNDGNRKGRGEGYFDRFLEDIKGKKKIIGICYKNQVKDKIIPNSWDIPVDEIIVAD